MPATEFHGSFGRSILSLRRDQVRSVDAKAGDEATRHEVELEAFQRQVADRFADLGSAGSDELLSLSWIGKLLDAFLCCQEDFRAIIFNNQSQVTKPPTDRLIADYFERSVKALDVCNAIRDGIEQIKQLQKLVEIVTCALDSSGGGSRQRSLGEGQFRRAKKALIDLAIAMLEQKDSSGSRLAHRHRSFSRNNKDSQHHRHIGHFRSLSWSVSRSWSAAKQLQAIGNNLATPRVSDVMATDGLAVPIYTMASILLFVTWALVAAIPCQDRGLHVHFYVPKNFQWSAPIMSLHDRILEESKKRERKNACGLLKEIYQIETSSRSVSELVDSVHKFPLTEEKETEVKNRVQELVHVYDALREGLDPLETQVREVFHRIVRSRTEGFDYLGKVSQFE